MGWKLAGSVLVTAIFAAAGATAAECKVLTKNSLNVALSHNRPVIDGAINGAPIRALLDTGSELSLIWRSEAVRLGLPLGNVFGAHVRGVGGKSDLSVATVKNLLVGGMTGKNMRLAVAGEGNRPYAVILGQDFFSNFEVEFDFANKLVTLFRTEGCRGLALAYWTKEWQEVELERPYDTGSSAKAQLRVRVEVNGVPMLAMIDSGSPFSTLNLAAARQVGIAPDSAGVVLLGKVGGVGAHKIDVWGATFTSFKIGEETIYNAKIRIADLFSGHWRARRTDLVLGADFLQAHRIMIANSQRRLYFTYNGGPVFQAIVDEDDEREDPLPAAAEAPPSR